jgi:polyisoprenoid-binding protein YceI
MAWAFDLSHTSVGFSARHMGLSTVRGRFHRFNGTIVLDPSDLSKTIGRLEIDASSIDTGDPQRDEHLRSPDFFDVEHYPTIVFEPTSIERIDDEHYRVRGNLTIKSVTREVELIYEHAGEAVDPFGKRKLGGRLTGEIKRSDWGLTWNVALEAGGWLVSDAIKLEIEGQVVETEDVGEPGGERETREAS